jgi:Calcineurin-like phosphoesterase
MQRTIIVGDVHGCADELRLLLGRCGYTRGDRVVLAGDLVAKGPDSQGVVQFARENGLLAVLGNHDAYAIAHRHEGHKHAPEGRRSYIGTLQAEDWEYLQGLPLYLRLGPAKPGEPDYLVVHAGLVPGVPVDKQKREHLLSMRSIADTGEPTSRLLLHYPWAARWEGPEKLVFGHDAVRGLQHWPLATGLDSGCVYGRLLTALILPEGELVQLAALRRYAGR